ncbi:MAG: ferredoxin [Pseudobdellovibrionaceae bacterium]
MPTPKVHLFICTNSPDKKGKCGYLNSEKLRKRLKERISDETDWSKEDVRVNASGCLGQCENGIAAVIYPKREWFFHLEENSDSEDKIWKALTKAVTEAQGKYK